MVMLTWGQVLALAGAASLPWAVLGFWIARLTRTGADGVERAVFPMPPDGTPHRRRTDEGFGP